MDLALVNTTATYMHLVCLGISILVAVMADIRAARSFTQPLSSHDLDLLKRYHSIIAAGLLLCWVSGLVLIWLRTGFHLENFSPKLMTKIIVVVALSATAFLMGRVGLPTMIAARGIVFGQLPIVSRLKLSMLAGLSVSGWSSAFLLGAVPTFKTMGWEALGDVFGSLYLAVLAGAFLMALLAPLVSRASVREFADARFETPVQRALSQL